MNKKDIEQFITKEIKEYAFYRRLPQNEEPIPTIMAVLRIREADVIEYVKDNYGENKYSVGWVTSQGGLLTKIELFERNYIGTLVQVSHNGLFFNFSVCADGEINRVHFVYNGFKSNCGWMELYNTDDFNEYVKQALKIVQDDKRKIMNHYNKLLKDTKADYRERLEKVNAVLKASAK